MNRNIHFNLEMLNINQVSSFTYVIAPFNRGESFNSLLNEVSNCPFDLLILGNLSRNLLTQNLFHSSSLPLKDKLIIGYVDIGASTSLVTSQYLGISNSTQIPSWFGNYESGYINSNPIFSLTTVQYWQPQWLNVIKQQIDDQINAGYDGIFLDEITSYLFWTTGNEANNPVNPNAEEEMVSLIKEIYDYIQSKNLSKPFYLIPNNPGDIIKLDPSIIKCFSAIFNECNFWVQDPNNGQISVPATWNTSNSLNSLNNTYSTTNLPVLANDYPPLTSASDIIPILQSYILEGWIPGVQKALQNDEVLISGPNILVATSSTMSLQGTSNNTNYLIAAKNTSPILTGGENSINYFLLAETGNIANGGKYFNYFYMHPSNDYQRGSLQISLSSGLVGKANIPNFSLAINGVSALSPTPVTILNASGNQTYSIDISNYTSIKNIQVVVSNTSYTDSNNFSNVHISNLILCGVDLNLSNAIYTSGGNPNGFSYSNSGTVTLTSDNLLPSFPISSNSIFGSGGVSTAIYQTDSSNFVIANNYTNLVVKSTKFLISDTLNSTQRVQFNDKSFAYDLQPTQSGGQTLELLGAAFGVSSISNKQYVGIGLNLFDSGQTMTQVAQLAINTGTVSAPDNSSFVKAVWTNVMGSPIDSGNLNTFVGYLNNGTYTQASLLALAAGTTANQTHINLVGLAQTGVQYS